MRDAIDSVAEQLEAAGQPAVTITLRQHVLDAERDQLGSTHPDTLTSQSYLAGVLDSLGRYDEAEQLHRRALATRIDVLGPDHPNTLASQNNLALLLQRREEHSVRQWARFLRWRHR
ncbi:tetratricopeptide repeat protein [Lentzea sp. PSKA42]|uniref:Tetratricopeptide repeat protein n=1 Tax=Lentzea indica TaxID=2604800 RepID=A0ABX1FMD6_9PSEU|nr:tetratricopeptide repeat protein [Lentzea indica]